MLVVGKATGEPVRMEMEEIKVNQVASRPGAAQSGEKNQWPAAQQDMGSRSIDTVQGAVNHCHLRMPKTGQARKYYISKMHICQFFYFQWFYVGNSARTTVCWGWGR